MKITTKKRIAYIFFSVITLTFILFSAYHKHSITFTRDKWFSDPQIRYKIVDNLLESYDIVGMNLDEVIDLLGNSDMGSEGVLSNKINGTTYELRNSLAYFLGVNYVDSLWLVLSYDAGIIYDVNICVT